MQPTLLSSEYCGRVSTAAAAPVAAAAAHSLGSRHWQCKQNWLLDLATRPARKTAVADGLTPFGYHFATVAN
jgi:hypothetical protein